MRPRDPREGWSAGDRDRHRGPLPLEALAAERVVWKAVLKTVLRIGVGGAIAMVVGLAFAYAKASTPFSVATMALVVASGFVGGVALGLVTFLFIRTFILLERWAKARRRTGASDAEPDERPWRLR